MLLKASLQFRFHRKTFLVWILLKMPAFCFFVLRRTVLSSCPCGWLFSWEETSSTSSTPSVRRSYRTGEAGGVFQIFVPSLAISWVCFSFYSSHSVLPVFLFLLPFCFCFLGSVTVLVWSCSVSIFWFPAVTLHYPTVFHAAYISSNIITLTQKMFSLFFFYAFGNPFF